MILEDHTREYKVGEEETEEKESITIMMKKDEDDADDDDVLDMQKYDKLEAYVRKSLKLRKKLPIKLICLVPYDGNNIMCAPARSLRCVPLADRVTDRALSCRRSVIKDQSSLKAFHRSVSGLGYMKLQTTPQLVLAVCPVAKDTGSLVPRAKRGGKVAQYEADTRALREMLYGKGSGRGRQGKWEAEADEWMADHPSYLEGFVEMREVVYMHITMELACV